MREHALELIPILLRNGLSDPRSTRLVARCLNNAPYWTDEIWNLLAFNKDAADIQNAIDAKQTIPQSYAHLIKDKKGKKIVPDETYFSCKGLRNKTNSDLKRPFKTKK